MGKTFNVTADCKPDEHYMVNLDTRIAEIKALIDEERYFTINRARQYGKTTLLRALNRCLRSEYYVVLMDFQTFGNAKFRNENVFALSFASTFLRLLNGNQPEMSDAFRERILCLQDIINERCLDFEQKELFEILSDICGAAGRKIVLMIDEVDSVADNQVFLDFLAQLRACYIDRDMRPTFQSVILAGVYDVKNLKKKIRSEPEQKRNSPWNIAADFKVDMSFSKEEIAGMLREYERDHQTGMDIAYIAGLLYDYTAGYPFLVSRLCKLMDEEIVRGEKDSDSGGSWTKSGFEKAVSMLLSEKNTLFESLIGKLGNYPELNRMLETLLFTGKEIAYNADNDAIDNATMFGFIVSRDGMAVVANRIFEMRLYNFFLSTSELQEHDIYKCSLQDRNRFVVDGRLNMRLILERFVVHFQELYGDRNDSFLEEEGRKFFLLYLKPIINGTGNYYIESRTRGLRRTDVIVDYRGGQYVIEMKIWRGEEYNSRGEKQLAEYLEAYHLKKGYMLSFNFNKKKQTGVFETIVDDKIIIEAVV